MAAKRTRKHVGEKKKPGAAGKKKAEAAKKKPDAAERKKSAPRDKRASLAAETKKSEGSPLFARFSDASRVTDVTDLMAVLSESKTIVWKPVGDNDNNLATINLGSDPAAGVIERVTNAIDAVLERAWLTHGEPSGVLSPRQAVAEWFGIANGRLNTVEKLGSQEINDIADMVEVSFRDSEKPDRPTVDIRDTGVGLRAEEFASTILSVKGNRKLRKLYLAGAFGQGGLSALSYSHYTIILSRATGKTRTELPPVAATIVRFNPGNPRIDKHGLYEYMVDYSTGQPFLFDEAEDVFPSGTLVRHVSMELSRYRGVVTAPTNSPWWLTQNYLFDPILPFRIVEKRKNAVTGEQRMITGNNRLLTYSRNTEYQRQAQLTFRDGAVTIAWWVLDADGEDARNRITQYAQPSKPIVVTYNGQKQGDLPNTVIKVDLRLPYLERYIVVHVDCDDLDPESRRQLFPTTRESIRDSLIGDDLRRLVVETLSTDGELVRLDRERKQRYTRRVDSDAVDQIRRRLAHRIRVTLMTGDRGKSPRTAPPESGTEPSHLPPIPVQNPPTLLEVTSPIPRRVYAGRTFHLRFRTDADPALFANPDTFIAVIDPPSFGQYSGTTNVRNGYGTAHFRASEDLDVGALAEITLEVRPRRAPSLKAAANLEVVPLPSAADSGAGSVATPNITPHWVTSSDLFWKEHNWTADSVAAVVQESDAVDIYVSADNRRLGQLIARGQRRDLATVESVKSFYLEHISYHAMLAALDQEKLDAAGGLSPSSEVEQDKELRRACETLCGIMDDIFDLLVDRAAGAEADVEGGVLVTESAE